MKAIVFDTFGGTEVLHEAEIEVPQPGPGQVRVRVRAIGVNPVDGKIRSGIMEAIFPTTLPAVPGGEIAGIVDALGEGVDRLKVGDEVLGWSDTCLRPVRTGRRGRPRPQAGRSGLDTRGRAAGGE